MSFLKKSQIRGFLKAMAITAGNADNDVVLNIVIGQSENRKYFPVFL